MTDVRDTARSDATSSDPSAGWSLVGPRDRQLVGPDWAPTSAEPIDGVVTKRMANVLAGDGPPGVWHAVRNVGTSTVVYINVVDVAYDYVDPDHYRLPLDTPLIPFTI